MTEETLFELALRTPEAERAALLDRACEGKPELRARVEALLQADDASSPFSNPSPFPEATTGFQGTASYASTDPAPGILIAGRYTLELKLGEGGMGEVWVAKQSEPVKRKVALKLIKAGMDSKSVIQRFEQERQALAMMDHPHIAKVLDGGLTSDRRPFFVMELVNGLPLNKFCDEAKLGIKERLELFVPICQAVQHAHQKGIVHRDLKPSNILVTMIDGKPIPKVIDFGVAKATGGKLTDESMSTQFGAVIGTLEYMSPEQAGFSNQDVDTRADIYSLGVILYELLTGLRPFDSERLKQAALDEVIRIIREEEPSKPSTKLSTDESLPSLAAVRHIEPAKLTALLRGELDWVVMKCLEKHRDRRYETANGLARDIQRYLADEAVEARPPSAGYRLRKFVRRNRGKVMAAGLVAMALVLGVVGTTWGLIEAKQQERLAMQAAIQERQAKQQAEDEKANALKAAAAEKAAKLDSDAKRQEAERNLAFARKGNDILGSVFTGLDPNADYATIAELRNALKDNLAKAVKELDGSAIGDPLEVAAMQNTLGQSLFGLGEAKLAVEVFGKSFAIRKERLGPDHSDTLASMGNVAAGYHEAGKLDLALPLFVEALKLTKAKFGPDHPDTLTSMNNLALGYQDAGKLDLALPLFVEALKLRKAKHGPDHPVTLDSMGNLARGYQAAGQLDKALPLLEETLTLTIAKLGTEHPKTLTSMNNLALSYRDAGKLDLALPLYVETLKLRKAKLGPDHPNTLTSMNNLAMGYRDAGKLDLALPLYMETLSLSKAKHGPDHPFTFGSMNNLALGYRAAGKLDLALPLYEETLKLRKSHLGPGHPDTLTSMNNLAAGYQTAGKLDLALPLYQETLNLRKAKLGPDHPDTLNSMGNLALGYLAARKLDLALPLSEETLKLRKAKLGPNHPDTLNSMGNLAGGYQAAGQLDKALPLLEETLTLMKARLGTDHPDTLRIMNDLAACYWSLKQLDKSVLLFEELLPLQEKTRGRAYLDTQRAVANLGVNYKDAGRVAEAIPLLEEAQRAAKKYPTLRWVSRQLLDAYAKAGKPAEAAKLIDELLVEARNSQPKDSPQLAVQLAQFGRSLLEMKGYSEAEPLLRECLAIREKTQPDAWTTFNTKSILGAALLGQKKYTEAEPLLIKGYEGMVARLPKDPPGADATRLAQILSLRTIMHTRINEALDRLILLFTVTNKPDEVKKWQAEKEKISKTPEKK